MTAIQPEVTSSDTDRLTKQAARGGGIALVGLLAGQGLTLAVNVMLTRVLGAASYGVFALGQSVVNANQALTTLGATQAVVRFGAMYAGTQDRGRLKGILSLGLLFSVAVNSLLGLMVFLGADFLAMRIFEEPDLARVLKILAFAFPLFAILRVASAGSRSLKRIEYDVGVQQILQPALTFVFVGIAFLLGYRLLGAVGGFLLALMISALVAIWLLIRAFPDLITRLAPIFEVRNFVSFAASLFLVGLSVNLLVQVDKLLLGFFLPAEQVGIYSVAATVARKTAIFLAAFGMIFEPIISDLYHRKQIVELDGVFKTVTKWTISLTLPLCVVVALFSQEILAIFGSEFIAGKAVLIVLILGQLVNTSVGRVGSILIMTGKQNIELANSVITLVLVVLLNVLLIPPFGILGAAVATSIGISLMNIGRLLEVYGFLKIQPYQASLWKPAVAAMASIAFGLWIKNISMPHYGLWVIQAAGVAAFYAFVMFILGFDQEDKLVLLAIRQKLEKGA